MTLVGERSIYSFGIIVRTLSNKRKPSLLLWVACKNQVSRCRKCSFITRLNRGKYSELYRVEMTNFSLLHADKNVLLSSPNILLTVVVSIHKRHWLKSWCGFCGRTVIYQGLLTEALCWATKKDNCAALLLKAPLWENLPRPRLPPNSLTPPPVSCVFRLQSHGMMAPVSVE